MSFSCSMIWEVIVCFVDIGGTIDYLSLIFLSVRYDLLFCWYWWNSWDHHCLNFRSIIPQANRSRDCATCEILYFISFRVIFLPTFEVYIGGTVYIYDRFMWLVLIKIVRIYLNLHSPRKNDAFDAL